MGPYVPTAHSAGLIVVPSFRKVDWEDEPLVMEPVTNLSPRDTNTIH